MPVPELFLICRMATDHAHLQIASNAWEYSGNFFLTDSANLESSSAHGWYPLLSHGEWLLLKHPGRSTVGKQAYHLLKSFNVNTIGGGFL